MMITGSMMFQATALAATVGTGPEIADLLTGTFSNEEQVYFAQDAGRSAPPWLSFRITGEADKLLLQPVDAYGTHLGESHKIQISGDENLRIVNMDNCSRRFDPADGGWVYSAIQNRMACRQRFQIVAVDASGLRLRLEDDSEAILKRARNVECWAAVAKGEPREDGKIDWLFARNLALHDQGGRVRVGGGDSGTEPVTLRMRAVHWPPPSTNRPSMVLYVHKDDPDRSESYSWADINASRIGINLRWMQASCTIPGADRESEAASGDISD